MNSKQRIKQGFISSLNSVSSQYGTKIAERCVQLLQDDTEKELPIEINPLYQESWEKTEKFIIDQLNCDNYQEKIDRVFNYQQDLFTREYFDMNHNEADKTFVKIGKDLFENNEMEWQIMPFLFPITRGHCAPNPREKSIHQIEKEFLEGKITSEFLKEKNIHEKATSGDSTGNLIERLKDTPLQKEIQLNKEKKVKEILKDCVSLLDLNSNCNSDSDSSH